MDSIKNYVVTVICAAVIAAFAGNLMDKKGALGDVTKLISGIFLLFTLLSPLPSLELSDFSIFTDNIRGEAEAMAALGQSLTEESRAAYIKEELEAYILDKATEMNAQLELTLTLDSDLQPESVIISGIISPYAKFRLASILEADLGIAKENQQWNES